MEDAQFVAQRELSTREIARIFRVPAVGHRWPSGDSMTYANVSEQAQAFAAVQAAALALTPIEQTVSDDTDLSPGTVYAEFLSTRSCVPTRDPRPDLHRRPRPRDRVDPTRRSPPPGEPARGDHLMPDRPTAGQLEDRALPLELDGRRIRGLIPYGVESRDLGGWREVIDPGALAAPTSPSSWPSSNTPASRSAAPADAGARGPRRRTALVRRAARPAARTSSKPSSAAICAPARGACASRAIAGTATSATSSRSPSFATSRSPRRPPTRAQPSSCVHHHHDGQEADMPDVPATEPTPVNDDTATPPAAPAAPAPPEDRSAPPRARRLAARRGPRQRAAAARSGR